MLSVWGQLPIHLETIKSRAVVYTVEGLEKFGYVSGSILSMAIEK